MSHPRTASGETSTRTGWWGRLVAVVNYGLVAVLIAGSGYALVEFTRAASRREPPPVPPAMEEVDWSSPESSEYCLACHRPVGPAMAGLDVEHGHPQNVHLSANQVAAIEDLNTNVGPENTLICMTCHTLRPEGPGREAMLVDTLADASLCERCHPGHYARGTPHDLRLSAPEETNRLGQTAEEGGPCSACHLAHRYARDFEPCAHDPAGRCTTCHERYHCAEAHARTSMEHPEARCLECHDPHDPSQGNFLKEPVPTLCVRCHEGYDGGALAGMHPVGHVEDPVPETLLAMRGDPQASAHELTCTVCHATHTAEYPSLLVMRPDSNELCLRCHEDKLVSMSTEGVLPKHGQSPILNAEQRALVDLWGTRVGPEGELLCVSCHRIHGGKTQFRLLAFQPRYGETCGACHPHHDGVFGTSHDLRTNFPDEENVAGMSVSEFGACSACHLAHRYAREPHPITGDPSGQCGSCHQADACAENKAMSGAMHPDTTCTDCHNPHERAHADYLVQAEAQLCISCHAETAAMAGGPHDYAMNPEVWPEHVAGFEGLCLPCHVPHGGDRADLFRVRGDTPVGNHDDVCLVCHADAGWEASSGLAAIHPHEISPEQHRVDLSLVPKDDEGNMRMGCRTCHEPHGGVEPRYLTRVDEGMPTEFLCLKCHQQKEFIRYTGHSPDTLKRFGFDTGACRPCHAMHAEPTGAWGQMLSPRFLNEYCVQVENQPGGCLPCLACHRPDGPAPVRAISTHPEKEMWNSFSPDDPGYLPLFNKEGHVDVEGDVTCRTCHVSHGRLELLERMAKNLELTEDEKAAIRAQVRPFIVPNICSQCHGLTESRYLYLFFHNPERREKYMSPPEEIP